MMYLYKRIYALQSQGSRQSHLKKRRFDINCRKEIK
jgi:hypothetical protein